MNNPHRRLVRLALVTSLIAGSMFGPIRQVDAGADPNALRARAQAELAVVTVDVDRADIMYSPDANIAGGNFSKVAKYQLEYLAGRQSFDQGNYAAALQHLSKADQIIRSQPDWRESQ